VKIQKQAIASGPQVWSVAELGAFYTEHSFELKTHANRILKDQTRADEVVQDAFIKVMLAAPELESAEHALGYLHRTIENLCIDVFRAEGRRPNLVVLDDATAEIEANWQDAGDHSQGLSAAEDAAIIRQALALLSPAERTALVMWEMDGRSTAEIAAELGIKESSVRHTVSRARTSLRNVLSTLIIDEERDLTALDMLSTSYKKAAELAKKSSRAALSLFLVVGAFLGFQAFTGHETKIVAKPPTQTPAAPVQAPAHVVVTTPASPTHQAVAASLSRSAQLAALIEQLQFAQVELGAQVDLLGVINDTNLFGQNRQVAALTIQPSTPEGGAGTN
jgi:RNA polymerase sigma factor (sigma-70 family)